MTLTRDNLGPSAQRYYDAHKTPVRPKPCPKCQGVAGNARCVLCRGTGIWNPLPSSQQTAPLPLASAVASARTIASQDGEKVDAEEFKNMCEKASIEIPKTEYHFHPTRKYRFDYAWPSLKIALEVDGGAFVAGRHNRGGGFKKDMERSNSAIVLGWVILRVAPDAILKFETVELVMRVMRTRRRSV